MKRLAIILALVLTGCATTRHVVNPCLTLEQHKKLADAEPPKIADQLTGQADEDVRTIGGSAVRLRGWGRGLLGVLEGCARPAAS